MTPSPELRRRWATLLLKNNSSLRQWHQTYPSRKWKPLRLPAQLTGRGLQTSQTEGDAFWFVRTRKRFEARPRVGFAAQGRRIERLKKVGVIARQVTFTQVLKKQVNPAQIKGKVVLIGVMAPTFQDFAATPYRNPKGDRGRQRMYGVELQAQMVSQLLTAALGF